MLTEISTIIDFDEIELKRFGTELMIAGIVYSDGKEAFVVWLPDEEDQTMELNLVTAAGPEQWKRLLQQTDLMETEILAQAKDGTLTKAIVRKSQRQVDQKISWNVFRRDQYTCQYCFNAYTPLTVDHLVLWEEGGPTVEANLVAACKRCNKARGNTPFMQWLETPGAHNLSSTGKAEMYKRWLEAEKLPRKIHVASR